MVPAETTSKEGDKMRVFCIFTLVHRKSDEAKKAEEKPFEKKIYVLSGIHSKELTFFIPRAVIVVERVCYT